jgi:hypothetical protein
VNRLIQTEFGIDISASNPTKLRKTEQEPIISFVGGNILMSTLTDYKPPAYATGPSTPAAQPQMALADQQQYHPAMATPQAYPAMAAPQGFYPMVPQQCLYPTILEFLSLPNMMHRNSRRRPVRQWS